MIRNILTWCLMGVRKTETGHLETCIWEKFCLVEIIDPAHKLYKY